MKGCGCVLLLLASFANLASGAVIELRADVQVEPSSLVLLGQVATIHAADQAEQQRLERLVMSPAPAAGRTLRVTHDDVRIRLQGAGINLATIEYRGRSTTAIRAVARPPLPTEVTPLDASTGKSASRSVSMTPPSSREITAAAEHVAKVFRRAFRLEGAAFAEQQVTCELAPADVRTVLNVPVEQLRFRESQFDPEAAVPLTLWWTDAEGATHDIPVRVSLTTVPQVLAVRQALPIGAVLKPDDLTWVPADENTPGIPRIADAIGQEVTRSLRAGQRLRPEDLRPIDLVHSNDLVTVVVRRSGIVVKRTFKALSSGALHETVNLVAIDDPRLRIQGVVTGVQQASVSGEPLEPRNQYQDERGVVPLTPTQRPVRGGPAR